MFEEAGGGYSARPLSEATIVRAVTASEPPAVFETLNRDADRAWAEVYLLLCSVKFHALGGLCLCAGVAFITSWANAKKAGATKKVLDGFKEAARSVRVTLTAIKTR